VPADADPWPKSGTALLSVGSVTRSDPVPVTPFPISGVTALICATF
jgi:hypothetical protein